MKRTPPASVPSRSSRGARKADASEMAVAENVSGGAEVGTGVGAGMEAGASKRKLPEILIWQNAVSSPAATASTLLTADERRAREARGHFSLSLLKYTVKTFIQFLKFCKHFYNRNDVVLSFTPDGVCCRGAAPGHLESAATVGSRASAATAPSDDAASSDVASAAAAVRVMASDAAAAAERRDHQEYHYAFEARLRACFFDTYECTPLVVERAIDVDLFCTLIRKLEMVHHPDSIILERGRADTIGIRDNLGKCSMLVPTKPARSVFPTSLAEHLDRVEFAHHVLVPAEDWCKTMLKMVADDVEDLYVGYFETSHLLVQWKQHGVPERQSRFPIWRRAHHVTHHTEHEPIAKEAKIAKGAKKAGRKQRKTSKKSGKAGKDGKVGKAGGDVDENEKGAQPRVPMTETPVFDASAESTSAPTYGNWFSRALLMPMCCTAFNDFLEVDMQYDTDAECGLLMLTMNIHENVESLDDEDTSFVRMWIAPKSVLGTY